MTIRGIMYVFKDELFSLKYPWKKDLKGIYRRPGIIQRAAIKDRVFTELDGWRRTGL